MRASITDYLSTFAALVGWRQFFGAVLLILLCTVLESAGLLMLVPLLQFVAGTPDARAWRWLAQHGLQPDLATALGVFLMLVLGRVLLARLRDLLLVRLRLAFIDSTRARLEAALARAAWPFLLRLRHTDVMHVLFDDMAKVNQGTHYLMQGLAGLGMGLASLVAAMVVAPGLTLVVLLPTAVLVAVLGRKLGAVVALGAKAGQSQRESLAASRDFLAGLKLIKAHAAEAGHLAVFEQRAKALGRQQLAFIAHQAATRGWFEAGGALLLALVVYVGATVGGMGLPELVLVVLVFSRLLPVVREGHLQVQQLSHMLPAYREVCTWLQRCEAAQESLAPALPAQPPLGQRGLYGDITLVDVSFRFDDQAPWAVRGLSLALPQRSTTLLAGASGAGKTTLVDLALGLLAPTEGAVLVAGQPLHEAGRARQWRQSVAYVAQDPFLFPGSVRANLCWLTGPKDDASLWAALSLADADGFVRALPAGLDQALGERGEGLSGGERQRLALARALLAQPSLLVLDEPTSQLDAESHRRVQATIDGLRGRLTILMIAHRLESSRAVDQVVVLDDGKLVQRGAWDELAAVPGRFSDLLALGREPEPVDAAAATAVKSVDKSD